MMSVLVRSFVRLFLYLYDFIYLFICYRERAQARAVAGRGGNRLLADQGARPGAGYQDPGIPKADA